MNKVYQVFVSSTFSDLEDERRQVNDAIAKAGYLVAGMELFPAADLQQLDFIKRVIDRSDYYVVIAAGRYGSLADDGNSFTEHEFDYAKAKGIPVLAFIHADTKSLAVAKSDTDANLLSKLAAFREKLKNGRIVKFWKNGDELCTQVIIAISQAVNLTPGHGWIRGDQAVDPKVLQEMERLRIENEELKSRLNRSDELVFDTNIPGPNNEVELTVHMKDHDGMGNNRFEEDVLVKAQIGDVFVAIYNDLLAEPYETRISNLIGRIYKDYFTRKPGVYANYSIQPEAMEELRLVLEGQDLITVTSVGERHRSLAWSPTTKGRRYFLARSLKKIE